MSGDRLCTEVSRLQWGRPTWAIPVLLFLAVLLVAGLAFNLANLDTGGESFPGPSTGGTQPTAVGSFDPFLVDVFLVAFGGLIVAGIVHWLLHRPERTRGPPKPLSWWQILSTFLGLGFAILFLLLWPRLVHALQSAQLAGPPPDPGTQNATGSRCTAKDSRGLGTCGPPTDRRRGPLRRRADPRSGPGGGRRRARDDHSDRDCARGGLGRGCRSPRTGALPRAEDRVNPHPSPNAAREGLRAGVVGHTALFRPRKHATEESLQFADSEDIAQNREEFPIALRERSLIHRLD